VDWSENETTVLVVELGVDWSENETTVLVVELGGGLVWEWDYCTVVVVLNSWFLIQTNWEWEWDQPLVCTGCRLCVVVTTAVQRISAWGPGRLDKVMCAKYIHCVKLWSWPVVHVAYQSVCFGK